MALGKCTENMAGCLHDAGCSDEMINCFTALRAQGNIDEACRLLKTQRCRVLADIHSCQKQLDILDYLLCDLKKEKCGSAAADCKKEEQK